MKTLKRTVGMEMEGYIAVNPYQYEFNQAPYFADRHYDGSLNHADYSEDTEQETYGVEMACHATTDVNRLIGTHEALLDLGWHVDQQASAHVHVDASDYTPKDRAKIMMFNGLLKEIPFMFVDDRRLDNRYCKMIPVGWNSIFEDAGISWNSANRHGNLYDFLASRDLLGDYYIEKYQWTNIRTRYPTVEFRIFNGIESAEQIERFTNIAHNTVELVKSAEVEQLQFIAKTIWDAKTPEEAAGRYLEALNVDVPVPIVSHAAKQRVASAIYRASRYDRMVKGIRNGA